MTKTSKTTQKEAVDRIFALRKNGATAADAKIIVAGEFNTSVYKLTQWLKQHKTGTFRTVSNTLSSTINVSNNSYKTKVVKLNDLYRNLSTVVTRLCDPNDHDISYKEAGAISSVANNMIGIAKLNLEAHKYATKTASKNMTVDRLLSQ
tara:strand:- start:18 stop:464 length:447 start_codon:yes stop_codon:yes gene_type:complete